MNVKPLHVYQVTPVDTKWIDTNKTFEEERMQIRSRIVAKEDRPDLHAETPPVEAFRAFMSIAANHKQTFSIMGQEWAPTLGKSVC